MIPHVSGCLVSLVTFLQALWLLEMFPSPNGSSVPAENQLTWIVNLCLLNLSLAKGLVLDLHFTVFSSSSSSFSQRAPAAIWLSWGWSALHSWWSPHFPSLLQWRRLPFQWPRIFIWLPEDSRLCLENLGAVPQCWARQLVSGTPRCHNQQSPEHLLLPTQQLLLVLLSLGLAV